MIITADEYRAMGFTADNDELLERCLERAEYTIGGISEGRYRSALAAGGQAAECIRQAAAFQAAKLVKECEQAANVTSERVTVGDYSYAVETAQSSDGCYDMSMQAVRLLRASGCLFGGREVVV